MSTVVSPLSSSPPIQSLLPSPPPPIKTSSIDNLWLEYPPHSGTYIKRFGFLWKQIHEKQCMPHKFNPNSSTQLKYFYEQSFGSKTNSYNCSLLV